MINIGLRLGCCFVRWFCLRESLIMMKYWQRIGLGLLSFVCALVLGVGLTPAQPSFDPGVYVAEATQVLAQAAGPMTSLQRFSTRLVGDTIVPVPAMTSASGAVGAVLSGNRLVVRGAFRRLTAPLRDYATDPLNPPNPNITSAIHIHRGSPQENGPFLYALTVQTAGDGLMGTFSGEFNLSEEQVALLNSGNLYVDVHTRAFRGGELRGALKG